MRYFVVLTVIMLAVGCSPSATPTPLAVPTTPPPESSVQAAQIDLEMAPDPAVVGDSTLVVTVTQEGIPLEEVLVAARGDMNHAGMSPVLSHALTDAAGRAFIPFAWTMGGDWIVTISVTLPDGSEVSQAFNVSVQTE